ncbi:MAG: cytochrome c [Candidatus Marinimicrobia bacterium]|nr:cytochrome c [Candidatus Neomarinimicrobiota bacterium]
MIKKIQISLLLTIFLFSCNKNSNNEISYAFDIQPIFNSNCIHCHGNFEPSADLCLTNYDSLMTGDSYNGPVINPEVKPKYNILFQKVNLPQPPFGARMPLDGPPYLNNQEINYIWLWIKNGAKDN